jgi:hypothetical protein
MQLQALIEELRRAGRAAGVNCRLLNLDRLIEVKRAAGRPKDFEAIAELETVRARQQQPRPR